MNVQKLEVMATTRKLETVREKEENPQPSHKGVPDLLVAMTTY